jgi:hypothetical protein
MPTIINIAEVSRYVVRLSSADALPSLISKYSYTHIEADRLISAGCGGNRGMGFAIGGAEEAVGLQKR